jgi:hypothetical protein
MVKINGTYCHRRRRMKYIFDDAPFLGISESSISVSGNLRLQEPKLNGPN